MKRISKIDSDLGIDLSPLDKYVGKSCSYVDSELNLGVNLLGKSFARLVLEGMIRECGIEINPHRYQYRMIRVDQYGKSKNPSPFKCTDYHAILIENWENSEFRSLLEPTYIFFVITHGSPENSIFKGYVLYDFDEDDLESARQVWEDTREKIRNGEFDRFLTDKDTGTFFFKIHASSVACQTDVPRGGKEIPRSFWISRNFISRIISSLR